MNNIENSYISPSSTKISVLDYKKFKRSLEEKFYINLETCTSKEKLEQFLKDSGLVADHEILYNPTTKRFELYVFEINETDNVQQVTKDKVDNITNANN